MFLIIRLHYHVDLLNLLCQMALKFSDSSASMCRGRSSSRLFFVNHDGKQCFLVAFAQKCGILFVTHCNVMRTMAYTRVTSTKKKSGSTKKLRLRENFGLSPLKTIHKDFVLSI